MAGLLRHQPKGQQDRRWVRPKPRGPETALERARRRRAELVGGHERARDRFGRMQGDTPQGAARSRFKTICTAAGTARRVGLTGLSEGTDHPRPHVIMLGGP